jgi:hypothetical protein
MANSELDAFMREIDAVVQSGAKPVMHRWLATIHADGKSFDPYYVVDVNVERDYVKAYGEVVHLKVDMGEGSFQYGVLPFKDNLEVTLRRVTLVESKNVADPDGETFSMRYRATLTENGSGVLEGNTPVTQEAGRADRIKIKTVEMQLVDPVIEQLRLQSFASVVRDARPIEVIRFALTKYSRIPKTDDAKSVRGVDVVDDSNPDRFDHIDIPHLTKLIYLPKHIQQAYGVYTGGLGYFLQDGMWYVYPLFDVTRYPKSRKTLTILNVPQGRFPSPERSYRETDTQVIMLSTGQVKHIDISEQLQLNSGNGARFVDARRVMDGMFKTGGNKAVFDRSKNVNEFVAENRKTGLNVIEQSDVKITANFMVEYSKMMSKAGSLLNCVWENSNDSLIYPGMPCKYVYVENNNVQEIYGVVHSLQTLNSCTSQDIVERRYGANSSLVLFLNKNIVINPPEENVE